MNSNTNRTVVALLLGILALAYGLAAYLSFSLEDALTAIAHEFFWARGTHAIHRWDDWFFIAICALATAGAVGTFLRSMWGRVISLVAFGSSSLGALLIALAPESWRGVWFSTWVDREVAVLIAVLSIVGFGLLSSQLAKNGFLHSEVSG